MHKLYYFDVIGKGEAIRLACTYASIPFEDIRVSREEWAILKEKEQDKFLFGQMPVLETPSGSTIAQSSSIMRYIGRLAAPDLLYPSDLVKAALVDSILDEEADMFTGVSVYRYKGRFGFGSFDSNSEAGKKVKEDLEKEAIPRFLGYFEKLLAKSKSGWIADTEGPSIADFVLVPRLEWVNIGSAIEGFTNVLDDQRFTHLKALVKKFNEFPAVVDYKNKKNKK